jgi:hypothetical protein
MEQCLQEASIDPKLRMWRKSLSNANAKFLRKGLRASPNEISSMGRTKAWEIVCN